MERRQGRRESGEGWKGISFGILVLGWGEGAWDACLCFWRMSGKAGSRGRKVEIDVVQFLVI